MRPMVEFCVSNLGIGSDSVKKILEEEDEVTFLNTAVWATADSALSSRMRSSMALLSPALLHTNCWKRLKHM